jgi:hypothetical protein
LNSISAGTANVTIKYLTASSTISEENNALDEEANQNGSEAANKEEKTTEPTSRGFYLILVLVLAGLFIAAMISYFVLRLTRNKTAERTSQLNVNLR